MRLLLIEDSVRLNELLTESIRLAGWRVDCVFTIEAAKRSIAAVAYDLALVDLGLPDGDGLAFIREARQSGFVRPVLVITARSSIENVVAALDGGADDYLIKPFNHIELLARCRALLRRKAVDYVEEIAVGGLIFDVATGTLATSTGDPVAIAPRERSVLELLFRNAGRVVPKQTMEVALSDFSNEMSSNAVELAISRLRRRLGPLNLSLEIETIRGIGYLLREKSAG